MVKVYESAIVNAPIEEVWKIVRDFNGLPLWHSAIDRSEIEEGRSADSVGCVRNFYLTNGDNIREQLLALDDVTHRCDYTILKSGMALTDYHAILSLLPITETGETFISWYAEFNTAPEDAKELEQVVGKGVFLGGLKDLQKFFNK